MATQSNIVFPPNSSGNPGFKRHEPLLNVRKLKERYLFGVTILDDANNPLPIDTYQFHIDQAISEVEHDLDITITPTTFTEDRDYNINDYQNWSFVDLYHRPVISVESVSIQYEPNQSLLTFPEEWLRVYSEIGQLQITPTSGSINAYNINNSGFLPQIFGVRRQYPRMIHIEYTAGFEENKIPYILNHLIGLKASIPILDIAGDLILGAGIANQSISLDGLSQSVGSTSSATNAGYGARIISYQKQIKEIMPIVKNYYRSGGNTLMVS